MVYYDDKLVSYNVEGLLPTTRDTVTKTLHHITIDHRLSLSSVACLARAEGQAYRAQTALYDSTATSRAERAPVMLIANLLEKPYESYSIGPATSLGAEQDRSLLMPDAERTLKISTPEGSQTTDDGVDTLDITAKMHHVISSRITPMSDWQVRETPAMLTQNDTVILCWLCRDEHAMYRCPYFTIKQQLVTAYRKFKHHTTADARTSRLLMQETQKIDPALYVTRLRQARNTVRSLTEKKRKTKTPSTCQLGRWTPSRRR